MHPPDAVNARVVLIDDSEDIRLLLALFLEQRGLEVVGRATTLWEGIDATATLQPDAVVTDVHLPDENDLAVIVARLRAAAPQSAVIALSAAAPPVTARQGVVRATGCDAYFDKVDGMGHLADQVADIISVRVS